MPLQFKPKTWFPTKLYQIQESSEHKGVQGVSPAGAWGELAGAERRVVFAPMCSHGARLYPSQRCEIKGHPNTLFSNRFDII